MKLHQLFGAVPIFRGIVRQMAALTLFPKRMRYTGDYIAGFLGGFLLRRARIR